MCDPPLKLGAAPDAVLRSLFCPSLFRVQHRGLALTAQNKLTSISPYASALCISFAAQLVTCAAVFNFVCLPFCLVLPIHNVP